MSGRLTPVALVLIALSGAACAPPPAPPPLGPFTTTTTDEVVIYGEPYFGTLDASAPLILLFHQGGSNGRGEYAEVAAWLNQSGFRAIAWDQRAGGERLGQTNRTVAGLAEGTAATSYCDAYADLQAALAYVTTQRLAERVVVWGSSYSAALVFRLAKEYPEQVAALVAFSPAAGGPLVDCRARMWVDDVRAPMLVLRPASEMTMEASAEQRDILVEAGAAFYVVDEGVHGSSMLVDSRTGHDMQSVRADLLAWLDDVTAADR